ncbi:MAG TPA: hypothetical protein VMA34_05235 [Terracidiphilus sp.]|nr:hypothetical protein [Terracidiphilus sp.]
MKSSPENMNCTDFQAHLPELIASGEDLSSHPHFSTCELCRALLADLETIAQAARDLFPSVEPPDDLWSHIETAIQAESNSNSSPAKPQQRPDSK